MNTILSAIQRLPTEWGKRRETEKKGIIKAQEIIKEIWYDWL